MPKIKQFDYPLIAREGTIHLCIAFFCGFLATWLWGFGSIPVWVLVLFVVQFFRDPKRNISTQPGTVVSPASGKIVSIEEEANPYLEGVTSLKVSVFMNVFSVHSNLIPFSGEVKDVWYYPGKFVNAALDKASSENERNAVWIRTKEGNDIVSVQIAGLIARRILCYVKKGDEVETGQRYGFIRFGSRVDLYLPLETRLSVKLGQWVSSGNDVIGMISVK
ncbi:MAG: phosphatidylserine decarboxylase [Gammaproteobacteria bacterium]|nr:phosphatidylserine decarboxylase [Gammaproteobacteria bacterium]